MKRSLYILLLPALLLPMICKPAQAAGEEKTIQLIYDPEINDFLETLGEPIIAAAGLPKESVRFHLILDNDLNAFALPNRHIVFNSGLILAARDRDEVAGVMAHEAAHISAGHHHQLARDGKRALIQSLITSAAGIAVGMASDNSRLASAGIVGGQAGARSMMLDAIRRKERQADRLSILYLARSGFDPAGIATFMERLQRSHRMVNLPPPYLMSHPVSGERLDEARDLARRHPPRFKRPKKENRWFARIKAKLEVRVASDLHGIVSRMQRAIASKKSDDDETRYALALGYRYTGRLKKSEELLDRLLKKSPNDPYLLRERALTYLESSQLDKAEKDLRRAIDEKKEKHEDFSYLLAKVLNEAGKHDEAARILRRLSAEDAKDARALYLLGVVEGKRGRLGPSHLALARHALLNNEKRSAKWHFQKAAQHFPAESRERQMAQRELQAIKPDEPSFLSMPGFKR